MIQFTRNRKLTGGERGDDQRLDGIIVSRDDSSPHVVGLGPRDGDRPVYRRDLGGVDAKR